MTKSVITRALFIFLAFTPVYDMIALHLIVLHVRRMIGYWPSYDRPDPGTLNIQQYLDIGGMISNGSLVTIFVMLISYLFPKGSNARFPKRLAIIFWIAFLLNIINMALNPFFEWIVD